ncbi:MAG: hypothetical protein B7Y45_09690 [Sphingomonas sp. 28-66-16]|nr:MAG: hypothetical protein B7Y45_09690 [Sphingomonas sp. 28-66-16]
MTGKRPLLMAMIVALPLLLAACGGRDTDSSGATASEARQLNDAAAMLDDQSVSANAVIANDQEPDHP